MLAQILMEKNTHSVAGRTQLYSIEIHMAHQNVTLYGRHTNVQNAVKFCTYMLVNSVKKLTLYISACKVSANAKSATANRFFE